MISAWWLCGGCVGPAFEGLRGDQREPGADLSVGPVMVGAHGNIRLESPVF